MGLAWQEKLFVVSILVFASAFEAVCGDAMVTGTVFCDQCKDGERSWFDYPLYGVKVKVSCTDGNGQTLVSREEMTNWFGSYAVRFDGAPDLGGCYAQVSGVDQASGSGCVASAGPAQQLRLMYRMFDTEMYVVDSLLSQPSQPMSNCPNRPANPSLAPPNPTPVSPSNPTPVSPSPPSGFGLPPMPPLPFVEATACSHDNWTRPEYRCYWRGVNPDTKVSMIFGASATRRYGPDMTLWIGLQGRGDPYRTLLREAITSFLNSYNTLSFPYHTLGVVQHTNQALTASSAQTVLLTALRFKRANSGSYGNDVTCKFTPCK